MLKQIRGGLKGLGVFVIILFAFAAFAFTDVPSLTQLGSSAAVKVGDERFSAPYVQSEFNRAVQIRRQETGGAFTHQDALVSGFADQVLESIATSSALSQYAERLGLAVPRELVRDFLRENENFRNAATGEFDQFVLESILQRNNLTVQEFERRISEDLMRNQLVSAMTGVGPAPGPLVDAALLRQSERRRVAYLTVTDEMAGAAATPTEEDLLAYYEANIATFTAPEYRVFDMAVLTRAAFSEDLAVSEETLRETYEASRERLYEEPEKRTLYQITYDTEAEARAAAAALRQGDDFAALAEARGLDMAAVTFADAQAADILDPAVSEAAFAEGLEDGAILEPVQSLFGWTVVQVAEIVAPVSRSFEEVRSEIEAQFLDNDARRAMLAAIDAIEEERDTGATLAAAAEAAGVEVKRIGPVDRFSFERGGAIVDEVPGEALTEAFLLEEGEESEALSFSAGGDPQNATQNYVLVGLREIIAPAPIPFEEVRARVDESWRADERRRRVSAAVRAIRDAVEGGRSLAEAADEYDRAPIETVIDRTFENDVVSRALNEQIFLAELGDLVSGPTALGDAQAVVEVRDVSFARNAVPPTEEMMMRQYLGYQLDQELLEAFVLAVREDYGVEIDRARLEALYSADG